MDLHIKPRKFTWRNRKPTNAIACLDIVLIDQEIMEACYSLLSSIVTFIMKANNYICSNLYLL